MALNVYLRGETVELTGAVTDNDGEAAAPSPASGDAMVVRLKNPAGTRKQEDVAMTGDGDTGAYYLAYAVPDEDDSEGVWPYEVISSDGAGNEKSMGTGAFRVKARLA